MLVVSTASQLLSSNKFHYFNFTFIYENIA